jgi:hypothetical protein
VVGVSDATTEPTPSAAAASTGEDASLTAAGDRERPTAAVPTRAIPALSTALAVFLGAVAAAFLAAASFVAGAAGLLALAVLVAALSLVSPRLCRVAGATYVGAFLAAGLTPASSAPLVCGAILAVAAWDVADHGVGLAAQVGREAGTSRNELVHTATSLVVSAAAGALAYGVSVVAGGGQPVTALALLVLGGVVILAALRE